MSEIQHSLAKITHFNAAKVSTLNVNDHAAMRAHQKQFNENVQKLDAVKEAYVHINNKMDTLVRTHLKQEATKYQQQATDSGSMLFNPPSLFLQQGIDKQSITSDDTVINYQFLMFRVLTGKAATKFGDTVTLIDGQSSNEWDIHSLVNSFKYKSPEGIEIQGHDNDDISDIAKTLLTADKLELKEIIKKAFHSNLLKCNTLKNADQTIKEQVCTSFTDAGNPEFFIKGMTCMETFTMTHDATLCPAVAYKATDFEL
jgi:ribosomal protein L23